MKEPTVTDTASAPHADAVLEMLGTADTVGTTCSLLTPSLKARLKEMESGQVLLARVDDPTARLDVQAWCALTGNDLLATIEEADGTLNFFIRKKSDVKRET